jgi:sugar lactone lactonase YvrE
VERRNVAEIDLKRGKILDRHPLPQPQFPNDIVIGPKGDMYVSDTRKSVVYFSLNGPFEEWIRGDELARLNGLCMHGNKLLVGVTSDHSLKSIDLKTKKIETLVRFGEGLMDGIKIDTQGNFLITHYEGRIYRVTPSGQVINLLYDPNTRCADFDYIPNQNLLIIPSLEGNSIMAYKMIK